MKTNLLLKEIDYFIFEGHASYFDLSPADRQILVALYMESMGNDALECISESDDLDISLHKLKQFIYHGSTQKAYELADTLRRNAENYLSKSLSKLYDERAELLDVETKREAGFVPYQHKDNGEIEWKRA
jgi:hypothetical protein